MSKELFFKNDAINKIKSGVDKLANAVKTTLGPKGKTVIFRRGSKVIFTLDGVTVAKNIQLKDNAEQMGAELLQEIAEKTDKEAGDGTTTATILTQSLLNQGITALTIGIDPLKLQKGVEKAKEICIKTIKKNAKQIKSNKEVEQVATISSRDPETGKIIAEIIEKIGKDAIISVESGNMLGLHKEIVEGMELDKGYISPYFITNMESGECVLEEPYILTTSQVLNINSDIYKLLEQVYRTEKRAILVIADNVKGEVLPTLIINKIQGRLNCAAIQASGIGDDKREQLYDIAIMTGGKYISEETNVKCEDVQLEDLGRADKVIITNEKTLIIGGKGKTKNIKDRVEFLKKQIEKETSEYEKDLKQKRMAKLKGGVAIIQVGALSTQETMEKRYRIEDAVKAVKSALEEGIVPGAGSALYEAAKEIKKQKEEDMSIKAGMDIVANAIQEPARQILLNASEKPDVILEKYNKEYGYNSEKGEYGNLIEQGVIDPVKVVRCALENAISIVSLFLKTETLIVENTEEKIK